MKNYIPHIAIGAIVAAVLTIMFSMWLIDDNTSRKERNASLFTPTTIVNCGSTCLNGCNSDCNTGCNSDCNKGCNKGCTPKLEIVHQAKNHGKPLVKPTPYKSTHRSSGYKKPVGIVKKTETEKSTPNQWQNNQYFGEPNSSYSGSSSNAGSYGGSSVGGAGGAGGRSSSFSGGSFSGGSVSVSVTQTQSQTQSQSQTQTQEGGYYHGHHNHNNYPRVEVPEPQNTLLLMLGGISLLIIRSKMSKK